MALTKVKGPVADLKLDDLNDVAIVSATTGQGLVFNGTSWVNGAVSGGASYAAGNLIDGTSLEDGDIDVKHIKIDDAGGNANVLVGLDAGLVFSGTGIENTIVGTFAGDEFVTGSRNVLVGNRAGCQIGTGSNNILMGWQSGKQQAIAANGIMDNHFIVNNEHIRNPATEQPYIIGRMTVGDETLELNAQTTTPFDPVLNTGVVTVQSSPADIAGYVPGVINTLGLLTRITLSRNLKWRSDLTHWETGPRANLLVGPGYTPFVVQVRHAGNPLATLTFSGSTSASATWAWAEGVVGPGDAANGVLELWVTSVDAYGAQAGLSFNLPFYTTFDPTGYGD